jgi:hypothetical protein
VSKRSLTCTLLVALAFPSLVRADGLRKLDDAASSRRRSEPAPSRDSDDDSDEDADEDADEAQDEYGSSSSGDDLLSEEENSELAEGIALVFLLPFSLPIHTMDEPCLRSYDRYPYAHGRGHLRTHDAHCTRRKRSRTMVVNAGFPVTSEAPDDSAAPREFPDAPGAHRRQLAAQLDMEAGYMRQEVVPATLALRLQMPRRLELFARGSLLTDVAEQEPERAVSSNALLSWRFAQSERVDLRTGLGMRHFRLDTDRWGFDWLYGLDFFTRRRLVGHLELHLGSLGRAFALETRGTLGVMVNRVEIYAGGDVLALFGPGQKAKLGGAVGGVRVWF